MLGGTWLLGSINDVEERVKQRHKVKGMKQVYLCTFDLFCF